MNHQIRAKEVRLIGHEGNQVGVVSINDAQQQAQDLGLDLLLVTQDATPPVCKLVDLGQYKYEQRKKEKIARKGSRQQVIKEL
ncbi:translation initiation factor IF-3, partial [Candidatus Marinamargulisbacteria bacterium SCGC AG-439-L15]